MSCTITDEYSIRKAFSLKTNDVEIKSTLQNYKYTRQSLKLESLS